MDLTLTTRVEDPYIVVEAAGEIDVHTAPQLREQVVASVAAGRYHLVVDLEKVEFFDSTGLGVLVSARERLHAHDGSLRLVCTQERILKIFRITGLIAVFSFHSTVADATAGTVALV